MCLRRKEHVDWLKNVSPGEHFDWLKKVARGNFVFFVDEVLDTLYLCSL